MAFVEARHASPNNTSAHIHPQRTTQPGTTWPVGAPPVEQTEPVTHSQVCLCLL